LQATQASPRAKACKRVCLSNRTDTAPQQTDKPRKTEGQLVTRVWQKWRFSTPQTHLWLIKVWFSASTFVVKIATFAKPETVSGNTRATQNAERKPHKKIENLNRKKKRVLLTQNPFYFKHL